MYDLKPPAPLPGQPRSDELDMWDMLMSLDGTPACRIRAHAQVHTPPEALALFFFRSFAVSEVRPCPLCAGESAPVDATQDQFAVTTPNLPVPPSKFGRQADCTSPEGWAAAAAAAAAMPPPQPPQQPVTPLKPVGQRKSSTRAKAETKAAKPEGRRPNLRPATVKPSPLVPVPLSAGGMAGLSMVGYSKEDLMAAVAAAPPKEDSVHTRFDSLQGKLDLSAFDDDMNGDEGLDETVEEKRVRRMRRNRESAAMSRNRKKQYVEELESEVAHLHEITRSLKTENIELRRECARMRGAPLSSPRSMMLRPPLPDAMPTLEPSLEESLSALAPEDLISPILASESSKDSVVGLPILDAVPSTSESFPGGVKRAGSPLLGGASAKRASAASLAFMSTITLVTLSVSGGRAGFSDVSGGAMRNPRAHSPTARMLMSITEAALPWSRPMAAPYVPEVNSADDSRLWPSLGLGNREAPITTGAQLELPAQPMQQLPPPLESLPHVAMAPPPTPVPHRVIRAPQNSSWADVLRIEAAEKALADAASRQQQIDNAPTALAQFDPAAAASRSYARPPVFEHIEDEAEGSFDADEYDAQRYIFCSRAYMFDAAVRRSRPMSRRQPSSDLELELPSKMPPRFRDAAVYRHAQQQQQLKQLSDGGNATAPPAKPTGPVVTLLLPSAALHGVFGAGGESAPSPPADSELMQVQCQVLNASRFPTAGTV